MRSTLLKLLALMFFAITVAGCLTVEKKEYVFEITGKNSGKLTIKYVNIMSLNDSLPGDAAEADYQQLMDDYILGTTIEDAYPTATNIQKRLYEENGQLNGEVTMEFTDLSQVKLYQYDKKSPIMFSVAQTQDSEGYITSNGTYGSDDYMKVVFWPKKTKMMTVTTSVDEPGEDSYSLVYQYRENK
jgi:hypothetical protein